MSVVLKFPFSRDSCEFYQGEADLERIFKIGEAVDVSALPDVQQEQWLKFLDANPDVPIDTNGSFFWIKMATWKHESMVKSFFLQLQSWYVWAASL